LVKATFFLGKYRPSSAEVLGISNSNNTAR